MALMGEVNFVSDSSNEELNLDKIRESLIRQEDTIIFSLIERSKYPFNPTLYDQTLGLVPGFSGSLVQFFVKESEALQAKAGRFVNPEENAFFPDDLPPSLVSSSQYPQILYPAAAPININNDIWDIYFNKLLPLIVVTGDDGNYASTAASDLNCLQALSRRIHYGKFVAEVKFKDAPQDYEPAIRAQDREALMKLLTFEKVEELVKKRVCKKATVYGQEVKLDDNNHEIGKCKVDPSIVCRLYEEWVIPLTKHVEVEYLMITHTRSSYMNTLHKRGQSRGWAAVDLSEKQKHGLHDEADRDPYPPIATLHSRGDVLHNNGFATKSFSSVLQPSMNFPSLAKSIEHDGVTQFGNSEGNKLTDKKGYDSACKKLKELHGWADNNLIEDVITAVDGDINLASSSLKEMVFTSLEETIIAKFSIRSDDHQCVTNQYDIASVSKNTDLGADITNLGSVLEDALKLDQKESTDGCASSRNPLAADAASNIKLIPVESEWEENDVYLSNRKSALQVMRTASHHSRAATNAYLRGDHYSAQQHSLKARHEWLAAERLNVHAAREILRIRNSTNDPWKLDLHGLHKAEAIQVLQEHLKKIESQICINQSVSRDGVQRKNSNSSYLSLESPSSKDVGYSDTQANSSRVRPTSLQVITGVGNHSRGPAALPIAVRSFLDEKGYYYDDTRPGVIVVWPKFRQR